MFDLSRRALAAFVTVAVLMPGVARAADVVVTSALRPVTSDQH